VLETSALRRGHAFQGTGRFINMLGRALRDNSDVSLRVLTEANTSPSGDIEYRSFRQSRRVAELVDVGFRTIAWKRGRRPGEVLLQPTPYFQVIDPPRSVVGVLDTIPLELRDGYTRTGVKAKLLYRLAARAGSIITISEFSRRSIVQRLGVDQDRVTVAPLYSTLPAADKDATPLVQPPYLLSVCDLRFADPRKRLDWLIHVTQVVARPRHVKLVFVGATGAYSQLLDVRAKEAGVSDAVVMLGRVKDPALAVLYAHAEALLFPSRYEGFGLPCVEAFAEGCPVVVTRTTSLPEVAGVEDFITDDDLDAFCDRVAYILDRGSGTKIRHKARTRSLDFTPDKFAQQVLAAVQRLEP
jgi:glycosyltransferase involved in cell wall biosynthesis